MTLQSGDSMCPKYPIQWLREECSDTTRRDTNVDFRRGIEFGRYSFQIIFSSRLRTTSSI